MSRYVALLRGINVGGKNPVNMGALRSCLEKQGFGDVVTYIQSGNVLFTSAEAARAALARRIETVLAAAFNYRATLVLRTGKQMRDIVDHAPAGFGSDPDSYRYDVIFLKEPLTAGVAIKSVLTRQGVDQAHAGTGVLYFSRLVSRASQSQMSRIASLPIYQQMTIRNWNTTTTLLRMMEAAG